ncbi:hypothetical protein PUN28_010629 [Cardiocondyla obscurior]|uniref:Uncharacterized protein n=1 Tax=Cardiocondyla obscurior TaxID=286306 RepID=A0AAW2FI87_9HYME
MRRCLVRSLLPPKARPQNRQTKGRSPVCLRTCSFRFSLDLTHLPQNGQAKRRSRRSASRVTVRARPIIASLGSCRSSSTALSSTSPASLLVPPPPPPTTPPATAAVVSEICTSTASPGFSWTLAVSETLSSPRAPSENTPRISSASPGFVVVSLPVSTWDGSPVLET